VNAKRRHCQVSVFGNLQHIAKTWMRRENDDAELDKGCSRKPSFRLQVQVLDTPGPHTDCRFHVHVGSEPGARRMESAHRLKHESRDPGVLGYLTGEAVEWLVAEQVERRAGPSLFLGNGRRD